MASFCARTFNFEIFLPLLLLLKCRSHVRSVDKGVVVAAAAAAVLKWGNVAGVVCAPYIIIIYAAVSGAFFDVAGSPNDE